MNKSEQLIACLEGEIAKRDARIVELENAAESLRISRDYHHEQEVEYRRRWSEVSADLEAASSMLVATSKAGIQLRAELSAAKETISRYETTAENCDLLRGELAAIKGQVPAIARFEKHAMKARECLPECAVVLLSSIRRLIAAPAAPAADAGLTASKWIKDAEEWGVALNYAAWEFINECPEKSALLFNNTKGPLRAAIMKYAELVSANVKDSSHD